MAATANKLAFGSPTAITCTVDSLASDTNLLAGRESTGIDVQNSSNLWKDVLLGGYVSTGTSPTTARVIELWVVPAYSNSYPSVFDGTDSNETVTSRDILAGCARLAWAVTTSNTSNEAYYFSGVSVAALFGGVMPRYFSVFVVHNTGVNLNSSTHSLNYTPVWDTSGN